MSTRSLTSQIPVRYVHSGQKFRGGQGTVYVCRDTALDRDVAIKFITDVVDLRRLHDEIRALQALRSKHVIEIYDLIVRPKDADLAIVAEYLPGEDLWTVIQRQAESKVPLATTVILEYLYQLAAGIADIHQAGVVHRDIKPTNAKFDGENRLKIFDFGLARSSKGRSTNSCLHRYGAVCCS